MDSICATCIKRQYKLKGKTYEEIYGDRVQEVRMKHRLAVLGKRLSKETIEKIKIASDRIELFRQFGYSTLIIWQKELEDLDTLKTKLLLFHEI